MAMMVPPQMNPKYKTSLCKHWTTTGNCSIGSRCHFAHGERELRNPNDPLPQLPSQNLQDPKLLQVYFSGSLGIHNYKTTLCKYASNNTCRYQEMCHYAHSPEEMIPFEKVRNVTTQVLISNYVSLIKSHYLLNSHSIPGFNINQEQVELALQMEFQKLIVAQQLKFVLNHLDKMDYTQSELRLKINTAHELLNANNFPGCSQTISDIINRPNVPTDEKKHYQDILYESAQEGQRIVEGYQRQIFEFQCEQAQQLQETYQKSENPQTLFGNAPTLPTTSIPGYRF
ncbi:unnamed protein product [Paramecium pentaurelia]|uniref:C3H1-type domain-containing protein n=1 Tax=Paramecium pentaurelia TaxID=43138 RepID=A0A8S1V6N6_9CILI|nr:unnamed protein product [Paramecium pentaurelia]